MIATYAARRRIKIDPKRWREPGELVPEAHTWFRVDSYLHTGWLSQVRVEQAELRAAVETFCPTLGAQIYQLTGLDGTALTGAHRSPIQAGLFCPVAAQAHR